MLFLSLLAGLAGIVLMIINPLISIPLLLVGVVIATARYRLVINLTQLTYHDHLWVAGFKTGKKVNFGSIDSLFLNKNKYTQTVNSRVSTMTKYGTEYNAYIRFDVDEVHLLSSDSKSKVVDKLKKIKAKLEDDIITSTQLTINATIKDYTDEEVKELE